ncbi:MAG: stage II sporulation protein D [bacterium]|nr:stage II sporulation protein D [bacterium]
MIAGYQFKKINGEKVLVLYLNYDSEFGKDLKLKHKNSSMKEEIKRFIKEKKIKRNGEKIVLSVGGIILAVLLLTEHPTQVDDFQLTYVSDGIIQNAVVEKIDSSNQTEIKEDMDLKMETTTSVTEEIAEAEIIDQENLPSNEIHTNVTQSTTSSGTHVTNNNSSNKKPSDSSVNQGNSPQTNTGSESASPQPIVSEKQVTVYRSNGSVITLSLEEYLIGVVGAEMPASFPIEALKAQAIVSRTYALKKIENGGKLTDSVSTQRYKDNDELRKDWGSSFDTYYQKIKKAVTETKDLEIYYQGNYIDAVYHSTSNGKTEDAVYVWGHDIPYLKSVDSSWDKDASSYLRETSQDFSNVLTLLGVDLREDVSFQILSRDSSGRVLEIKVGTKIFTGVEFRNLLGLRSADFDLVLENGILNITTRGYGHGVGMSQYGAGGMAKSGYTYDQILNHYYTGVTIH